MIKEREQDIRRAAKEAGTDPIVVQIHGERGSRIPVLRELGESAGTYGGQSHVVLLITHEGMMGADLNGFRDWHMVVDENPAAIASGSMQVPATATYLAAVYDLEPLSGTKWSRLKLKSKAPRTSDLIRDEFLKQMAVIDKRARSNQGVYVDVADWDSIIGSPRDLHWWSAWTPLELGAFASITIVGAGYYESLGCKAAMAWFGDRIEFVDAKIPSTRQTSPRVMIHYYTRHRGSTTFWQSSEGKKCLSAVSNHLLTVKDIGYWASNKDIELCFLNRIPGQHVSPRQEGTNSLIRHQGCAMIYSAKALPGDVPLLEAFGIQRTDIHRAREVEDIIQFTMRGALRDPGYDGTYSVYLYSLDQAEALAAYLAREGIAQAELVPVDEAGIMDVERPKRGPQVKVHDERSKEERARARRDADKKRKAQKRALDRAQQELDGAARRGRGRPPKAVPVSPQTKAYRKATLNGLTPDAFRARYGWKKDLLAMQEGKSPRKKRR
nr:hypothetical protein [Prosthecomicrobium hirschii]